VVWRRLPVLHYLTLERWPGGQRAGNVSPESGRAGCAEGAADPVAKDLEALDWFVAEDESHMATGYLVAPPDHGRRRDLALRLAGAWHARVMDDEVVSHAFSHGFRPDHTERLAAYWGEALGGPASYSASFGDETAVVRIHSGNGPHEEMDRRAVACFDQALIDVGLAGNDRLRELLHDYFAWATRTAMSRYHRSADDVPDGLRIPHRSWDGLIRESRPAER
jgi:hemoglobin